MVSNKNAVGTELAVQQQIFVNADLLVKEYRRAMRQILKKHRMDDRRAHAISMLDLHGPCSVQQLSRVLERHKAAVSSLLMRMEEDGLVHYHTDPFDRRSKRVGLTAKGRELVKPIAAAGNVVCEKALSNVELSVVQDINDALKLLLNNVEEMTSKSK